MYRIEKMYYSGINETKVRLVQEEPYRDFVVSLEGDRSGESEDILREIAITTLAKEFNPNAVLESLEKRLAKQEEQTKAIYQTFILGKDLNKDQKENILAQFPPYQVGVKYKEGDKFVFDGKVYETIQEHTSQTTWIPSETNAIYKEYLNLAIKNADGTPTEVIAEFRQPTGAHDAYKIGDKVSYLGKIYKSKLDNNTYSPSGYPEGWEEVKEENGAE